MIIFEHRVNTEAGLKHSKHGVEIDIRSYGKDLVINHDPFQEKSLKFEKVVNLLKDKKVILNVKEEGLEERLKSIFNLIDQKNSFILDESLPFIIKYAKSGFCNFALRVSDLESVKTVIDVNLFLKKYKSQINWIWLDCFNLRAPSTDLLTELNENQFKICIVSPELHILDKPEDWESALSDFQNKISKDISMINAVCTKLPGAWS